MSRTPFKKSPDYLSKKNIITGRNPVIEALRAQQNIDKILLFKNATGDAIQEIRHLTKAANIPVQYVPNEKLNSLTNVLHQGVIAFKSAVAFTDLQQTIDWVNSNGEAGLFFMLDGITDVRNIGAIARSAVCCGAHALIIPEKGLGALQEDAMKSSAGALAHIHICRVRNLAEAIDTLQLNGIRVFATAMHAEKNLMQQNFKDPCCIIMGNEGEGIHPALEKLADEKFTIPMKKGFDSLNVSVAAGIILYEALKQRDFN